MVVTVGVKDKYLAFSFSSYGPATLVRSGGKIGKTKWALRGSSESKKQCIKNTLLLKHANHHLNLQQVTIFLHMEGLPSMMAVC